MKLRTRFYNNLNTKIVITVFKKIIQYLRVQCKPAVCNHYIENNYVNRSNNYHKYNWHLMPIGYDIIELNFESVIHNHSNFIY